MKLARLSSKGFNPIKDIHDVRFGKVKLYKDSKNDIYYTCKGKVTKTIEAADRLIAGIQKRMESPNMYYVPPADFHCKKSDTFCSNMANLEVFTPFPEEDLEKELKERIDEGASYTNSEITGLLYDTINGMFHLQKLGFAHGKLSPAWIARTTTGFAILDDLLDDPQFPINPKRKKHIYISPERYMSSEKGELLSIDQVHRSDVFSCGLIILEVGLLKRIGEFYRIITEYGVDKKALESALNELDSRYPDNSLLRSTVRKMLEIDSERRPDFIELMDKLPEYRLVKEYFNVNPDSAPITDNQFSRRINTNKSAYGEPRPMIARCLGGEIKSRSNSRQNSKERSILNQIQVSSNKSVSPRIPVIVFSSVDS